MKTFHGDEWRGRNFTGQTVGVIASVDEAARIVPSVVRTARSVKVFQEEPAWVMPLQVPVVRRRLARLHLRRSIKDPWTRRLLTPRRFGRRDVVISSAYYSALQRPNCKLVAWPVYAVVEHGVRTAEGIEHRFDVLVIPDSVWKALAA